MDSIPNDVIKYMLSFLDVRSIIRFSSTCKRNKDIAKSTRIFKVIVRLTGEWHPCMTADKDNRLANCVRLSFNADMTLDVSMAIKLLRFYVTRYKFTAFDELLKISIGKSRQLFEFVLTCIPVQYKADMLNVMPVAMECKDKHYFYRLQSMWNQDSWINNVHLGRPDYYSIAATAKRDPEEAVKFAGELSKYFHLPRVNLMAFQYASDNMNDFVIKTLEEKFPDTVNYIDNYDVRFKRRKTTE